MVRIGSMRIHGPGESLPRNRQKAKKVFRDIAQGYGVKDIRFVRTKRSPHGGLYKPEHKRIIVVEKQKSRVVPVYVMAFYFLHELVHHFQCEEFLFAPVYYQEIQARNGRWVKIPLSDARRLALRAENHADQKASELAYEFFGLRLMAAPYSKEALKEVKSELFE